MNSNFKLEQQTNKKPNTDAEKNVRRIIILVRNLHISMPMDCGLREELLENIYSGFGKEFSNVFNSYEVINYYQFKAECFTNRDSLLSK